MKRTPLRKVGKKRAAQMAKYRQARAAYLLEHPLCEAFCFEENPRPNLATEIHHRSSREGKLLLDEAHWLPICRQCHDAIHIYRVKEARQAGYLYEVTSK